MVSRGGVRRLPSPRGPSCWGPRGGSRARSWKLARLRLPRASQGRSPRPAEGATLQPRQGVESPAGLPGTGRAPERPASRGGDLVAIEAPHPRADFQLPGVDPKKIIQTQKERCVRIYSQRRKEMVPKNLGTSAQWNFFFSFWRSLSAHLVTSTQTATGYAEVGGSGSLPPTPPLLGFPGKMLALTSTDSRTRRQWV